MDKVKFDYIVVGAGQSGLAMAYELTMASADFLVLDAETEIGKSWLNRWDSLKLFTPTEFNHLPGLPFPAPKGHYPNKVDVASYLKRYVDHFNIPVTLKCQVNKVEKLQNTDDRNSADFQTDESNNVANTELFKLTTTQGVYFAKQVIVASGPFHIPFVPDCSKKISPDLVQLHSKDYRNPAQLQEGDVLVVGAGDSGFQILDEISAQHQSGHIFFSGNTDLMTIPQEFLGKTLWWWFKKTGILSLNKYSWLGKKISQRMQPIIGIDIKALLARPNITSVGRTKDACDATVICEHQSLASIKNIIWSTGFRPDFSWLEGVELDGEGYPVNYRGVSSTKGLYFIGLPWMYTRGSATLGGVKDDAKYLSKVL